MNPDTRRLRTMMLTAAMAVAVALPARAQIPPPSGASYGGSAPTSKKVVSGIAWFGSLKTGMAEARRTGKPILLVTAAAQCNGVPGMW